MRLVKKGKKKKTGRPGVTDKRWDVMSFRDEYKFKLSGSAEPLQNQAVRG